VGLLGASLGLALKQHRLAQRIVGVGRKQSPSLDVAIDKGAIDEKSFELAPAARDSDLIVLCTPIRQFKAALAELTPHLKPGAIVTDVGSTKAQVMHWAAESFSKNKSENAPVFIGSHPMAGSEKRGPENARPDFYQNAVCLLVTEPAFKEGAAYKLVPNSPTANTYLALQKIESLWRAIGMRTLRLGAQEHDKWVATISHLPHAVAFSLVNAASRDPDMLQAVAGGFIDTTRVASSDTDMWTDIFLTNGPAVVNAIDAFTADLKALKEAIRTGDEAVIRTVISTAKSTRDDLLKKRGAK
jgi:prephenate dehydrogenase